MPAVSDAVTQSAKGAVEIALGLVGQMALWLGLMAVLREAGAMAFIARLTRPLMGRLFPSIPRDHPAMGAMVLNIAANIVGLTNAATPFGLRAMVELGKLNKRAGVATNDMALFLAINTSGVAVLPLGAIAVRASLGSKDAASIVLPSLVSTAVSTVVAVLVCKAYERLPIFAVDRTPSPLETLATSPQAANDSVNLELPSAPPPVRGPVRWALWAYAVALVTLGAMAVAGPSDASAWAAVQSVLSSWVLPVILVAIVGVGLSRGVRIYEVLVKEAKEGFTVAITIIPFLVAILVAIGMFRASGAMDAFASFIGPVTSRVGLPAEAVPMALMRPFSGSGSLAVMIDTMKRHGTDTFVGFLVSLINGSSETTFYVLSVYFGAVQVRAVRHTLAACLTSDVLGLVITVALAHFFFVAPA